MIAPANSMPRTLPLPLPRLPPLNFQTRPAAPTSRLTCALPAALVICPSRKKSSPCLLTSRLSTHFGGQLWNKTKGMARRTGGLTHGCDCKNNWCARRDIRMLQRACTGENPCHPPSQERINALEMGLLDRELNQQALEWFQGDM